MDNVILMEVVDSLDDLRKKIEIRDRFSNSVRLLKEFFECLLRAVFHLNIKVGKNSIFFPFSGVENLFDFT